MPAIVTTDPVCGMEVDESSGFRAGHQKKTYVFCSANCQQRFEADPESVLRKGRAKATLENEGDSDVQKGKMGRGESWRDYIPLMVIAALTLMAACAKQATYGGQWDWKLWMHDFMGFFLIVFSMFKLFDIEGFADGFQMYDLLAKPFRGYAYLYPFIELGLGLAYLAHVVPRFIYAATIAVMVFGSLGVLKALRKGLDLECACMGTVLKVPLSTVALVEDLGMATMAAAMLFLMR